VLIIEWRVCRLRVILNLISRHKNSVWSGVNVKSSFCFFCVFLSASFSLYANPGAKQGRVKAKLASRESRALDSNEF